MNPLLPNSMVRERYLIVQMIGSGGMGEVYMAVDQWSGNAVALKRTVFGDDQALRESLEREANVLANIHHPVLPKVLDQFVENGDHYLVMEQISGDDLAKRMDDGRKPFPLSWSMFWADQLLDALTYLHSHDPAILHNDIKPKNLKLTDENHIVLLDFGVARNGSAKSGISQFSSPEQMRGMKTSPASDIYSFSAVFYQLVTNVPPVDALTRAAAVESGSPDPLRPPSEVSPAIPKEISDAVLKGLEIPQEKRFGAAIEMQKALRRAFKKTQAAAAMTDQPAAQIAERFAEPVPPTPSAVDIQETGAAPSDQTGAARTVEMSGSGFQTEALAQSDIKTEVFSTSGLQSPAREEEAAPEQVTVVAGKGVEAEAAYVSPSRSFQTPAAGPAAAKKSSSNTGLIIGGIVAVLLAVGIAAGGGWYVYTKYYRSAKLVASPTPTPSVAASPTPQPVLADANQNANSNANLAQAGNTNTNGADSNANKTLATVPTPGSTVTTRPTPVVTTKNVANRPPQTPSAKATPKAKGRDDRTVILQ